ncbi:MAG: acetylglutamate kinase [Aestuariivita sp.]|nr:acetylglutamate kinase [Aestuariivita sp.]MCY4201297.1 acetylglutamate kinase [Aestuariivita sp.]
MNDNLKASARTLSEALPFMQRYAGAIVVVKLGGHVLGNEAALTNFARDIVLLRQVGVNPVVVHGGAPMINAMLDRLSISSRVIDGIRVTDEHTIQIVEMVLSGSVNKQIVSAIGRQGGKAVGLSGKDARLMICRQTDASLGFVGTPEVVDSSILCALFDDNIIPVIAPIGLGEDGETYNVNGDTAAGAVAAALKADRLLLLTDVVGVRDANGELLSDLTTAEIATLTSSGVILGGMIPKTETALNAIDHGVRAVAILDGRVPNAVLLELFTEEGAGTLIRSDCERERK